MTQTKPCNNFYLGDWLVDVPACTLSNGHKVKVDYKQMQLLQFLVSKDSEVVSRNEILDNIWQDLYVADDVLNVAISSLRKALGDDSKNPTYIKTIPKSGYQIVAPVRVVENNKITERNTRYSVFASVLLATVITVVFFLWHSPTKTKPRILVMPLSTASSELPLQYLSYGFTQNLINTLASSLSYQVIASPTAHRVESTVSQAELIKTMELDFVIISNVNKELDNLSLTSRIVDKDNKVVWQEHILASNDTSTSLQRQMINAVSNYFDITPQAQLPMRSLAAIRLFEQAEYYKDKYQLEEAEKNYLAALAENEDFGPAYAGLAQLYFLKAYNGHQKTVDYFNVAKRYTEKAWDLDPSSAITLLNKALVAYFVDYDIEKSVNYFQQAQRKNPSNIMILEWYQSILINIGSFELAKSVNQSMREISPLVYNKTAYYDILYFSGDYKGALSEIESMSPYMNSQFWATATSAWVYLASQNNAMFETRFVELLQEYDIQAAQIENFQQVLANKGIRDAVSLFVSLVGQQLDAYSKAELLAYSGEHDAAISLLTRIVINREIRAFRIQQEPLLKSLHSNAEFQKLIEQLYQPIEL